MIHFKRMPQNKCNVYENYFLYILSFLPFNHFRDYEFYNIKRILDIGYGWCSQVSILVHLCLRKRGISSKIIGFKGHVHVAVGSELEIDSDEPEAIAELIDKQILKNYRLSDANYIAAEMLQNEGTMVDKALAAVIQEKSISESNRQIFSNRISEIQYKLMRHLLFGYANPLVNKFKSGYEL